jgi:hypothetical protein
LIKIQYAWSDGEIISEDLLYMDMDKFKQDFTKAYREALAILFEMPFYSEDMTEDYIRKATSEAVLLNAIILGDEIQVVAPVEAEVEEKEPEEEEEDEEEVGIGGLFG